VLREAFLLQSGLDHLRPHERVTESEPRLQAQIRNLRAVRIESRIILNRSVRSEAAAPERPNFETRAGVAYRKLLNSLDSHNLTKTAVVQLRQRKGAGRDEKWPKMGPQACPRGSEEWPQKPAFCAIPAGDKRRKENVPTGETGGGTASGIETLSCCFSNSYNYINMSGYCLENPGPAVAVPGRCNGRRAGARPARRSSTRTSSRAATPTCGAP
jgi:hypothetical protein